MGATREYAFNVGVETSSLPTAGTPTVDDDLITKAYFDNNAGGSGSGELNYISNPNAVTDITGWTAVGDLAVTRSTTAAELPRENTAGTGIKIVADADTQSTADYIYFDFTLDDVDLNRLLKIQFDQKIIGTYTAGQLAVVITTQADRTTAIATPSVSAIPAADGTFGATFITGSTATLSLVIRATADMTTGGGVCISNVVVGSGTLIQGAAVGDWVTWTPTSSWTDSDAVHYGKYRRVGDTIEIHGAIDINGDVTSGNLDIDLPSGLTINTAKLPKTPDAGHASLGDGLYIDASGENYPLKAVYKSTTDFYLVYFTDSAAGVKTVVVSGSADFPVQTASGDRIYYRAQFPITEWSSGVYLGSGADGTSVLDWTSFTPTGSWSTNTTYTGKKRRVGDSMEYQIEVALAGAPTSAVLSINLPDTIDTSKLLSATDSYANLLPNSVVGIRDTGTQNYAGSVAFKDATSVYVVYFDDGAGGVQIAGVTQAAPHTFANTDTINISFCVPVVGLTSADYLGKMLVGFQTATSAKPGLVKVSDGTYTVTNVTTDRSYDANATSDAEIADVLGTLIADLQAAGIIK